MPRDKVMQVACLNIAMQEPHSPERYREWLIEAYALKSSVRLGRLQGALLGTLYSAEDHGFLMGDIYRFIHIDANEPWFNTTTREVATDADRSSIQIPAHLRPGLQQLPFAFDPGHHRLYFATRLGNESISTGQCKKLFDQLAFQLALISDLPVVEVTVLPDRDAVAEILSMHQLQRLEIDLRPPNPDDAQGLEERLRERLKKMKAQRQVTTLHAEKNESIKPDQEIVDMATVAATNGRVSGHGRDAAGTVQDISTENKPLVHRIVFEEEIESRFDVLRRSADSFSA